jgi:serine/threonine protein phosphatase PrpC
VIALADGAGSARFSHFGADLVVRQASKLVAREFDRLIAPEMDSARIAKWLIKNLQHSLLLLSNHGVMADTSDRSRLNLPCKAEQSRVSCDLCDLASTLLIVATKGDKYIAMHLGDGVIGMEILLRGNKKKLRVLSIPDNGEFVNETRFVTSGNASDNLKVYRGGLVTLSRTVTGFILMSDGPESVLYHKPTKTLAPACDKLFQACRDISQDDLQKQLTATLRKVIASKTHDDCSIVLMAR